MSGIVLRGSWLNLHRRGARVWIRERPHEFFWRTTADFTVDDIRSVDVQPLRLELDRRRRGPVRTGSTRVVRPAVTRVVIALDTDQTFRLDLEETEATVVGAFADLGDRVTTPVTIDLTAEHAAGAAEHAVGISWRPPEGRDPRELVAMAERHDAELARDVSFKLELGADPAVVEHWLREQTTSSAGPSGARPQDELFPAADEHAAPGSGGTWIRKRRKKRMRRHAHGTSRDRR